MRSPAFAAAVDLLLSIEGGEALAVDNNGSPVRWGINAAANPDVDLQTLTRESAIEIYRQRYWQAMRCGELPPSLAVQVFDAAVNQGVAGATLCLQLAAGVVPDGLLGPRTMAAAMRLGGQLGCVGFAAERIKRYSRHPQWLRYSSTWLDRTLRFLLLKL
jgi:lysozyme family protein